jgi:hypothetical protein
MWSRPIDLLTLAIAIAVGPVGATGCGKKVPSEIRPTLDDIRPEARKVAEAAAKECTDQFRSGRFKVTSTGCSANLLPGETLVAMPPSPAKGTPLESTPLVLEVQVVCNAPLTATESCGVSLDSLHHAFNGPGAGRTRHIAEGDCKSGSTDCEEIVVPSQSAADETSADLRLIRPVSAGPAGATAETTVVLAKK